MLGKNETFGFIDVKNIAGRGLLFLLGFPTC